MSVMISHIPFAQKGGGGNHISGRAEKNRLFGLHIRTTQYIDS